mgnify:CR=1 FL=1
MNVSDKIKEELELLVVEGKEILSKNTGETLPVFEYQGWYTVASAFIKKILPSRLKEFDELYSTEEGYGIRKYFLDFPHEDDRGKKWRREDMNVRLESQLSILNAVKKTIDSTLFNVTTVLQARMFKPGLEEAKHLLKNGFIRCAGALAGVTLEQHLEQVTKNHEVLIGKKKPGIGDFNKSLYSEKVYDSALLKKIEWLADIRNKCDHADTEPTSDEVKKLIEETEEITKTVF